MPTPASISRRIVKAVQNSADLDATYHYYYDDSYYDSQSIIEVRSGSDYAITQYVWGT